MTVDEVLVAIMVAGGWLTFLLVLIFLPSTHRREQQEIKKYGHVRKTWNPKEY